jgi:hypothetical protein
MIRGRTIGGGGAGAGTNYRSDKRRKRDKVKNINNKMDNENNDR